MSIQEIAVKEVTLGVTPVNSPDWFSIPIAGSGGLSSTPVKVESNRVRNDLGVSAGSVVGSDIVGQYPAFEFKADQVDPYYESVMRGVFTVGVLENGIVLQSYSVQRGFDDLTNKYLNYTGAIVTQLDLVFSNVRELVTLSPTFTALTHKSDAVVSAVGTGAIVAETANRALTVLDLSNLSLAGLTTLCVQEGSLSLVNTATPRYCAGTADGVSFDLGNFILTGTLTVVTTDDSWRFFADKDASTGLPFSFDLSDGSTSYAHVIPNVQVEFPDPTTVPSGEVVTLELSMAAFQVEGSYALQVTKT